MAKKKEEYGRREHILAQRPRPGGPEASGGHLRVGWAGGVRAFAFFEILSNSIDEARAGLWQQDPCHPLRRRFNGGAGFRPRGAGRTGNPKEKRFNWELVYCELYAGGTYQDGGDTYEFSLGLNGLGSCATQYSSEYFDVEVSPGRLPV